MALLNLKKVIIDWIFKKDLKKKIVVFGTTTGLVIAFIYFHYKKIKKEKDSITQGEEVVKKAKKEKFPNVAFYKNKIVSEPDGDCIENILTQWKGDYHLLETNHNYIQWLFPNKTLGCNQYSYPLLDEEAKIIRETPELKQRVKRAFEMMLDFYGMRLTKDNKFQLADNATERLELLNQWGNHNFLRISRILLALKELGHPNLMVPWMKFLADLIYMENVLDHAVSSYENFWLDTLDAEDKIEVHKYVKDKQ